VSVKQRRERGTKPRVNKTMFEKSELPRAIEIVLSHFRARFEDRPKDTPGSQPNWATDGPESMSQPLANTSTITTNAPKRFRSDRDEDITRHNIEVFSNVHKEFDLLQLIRQRVFEVLRSQLEYAGVETEGLTIAKLAWCLPDK
jgi:hypothetical protein